MFLVCLSILVSLSLTAHGEVVIFNQYETDITLKDGILHVEREMQLKNVGGSPIIPGELHFKLRQEDGGKFIAPSIENVEASNAFNAKLTSTVIKGNSETDLVISVWDPMLPGFHYDLSVSYDLFFDPSGILFYEINIPLEDTTIPITENVVRFHIPDKYSVTYAPNGTVGKIADQNVIEWNNMKQLQFEYSRIPLPKLGIKAVNIFWAVIILLLLAMFFVVWRRRR